MRTLTSVILLAIVITCTSFSNASCDFDGNWETNWGTLELKSIGAEYTGTYYTDGIKRGTIKGKMSTKDWTGATIILKGTWEQGKAKGKFELQRYCPQKKFTGTWTNDNVNESGEWNGEKM